MIAILLQIVKDQKIKLPMLSQLTIVPFGWGKLLLQHFQQFGPAFVGVLLAICPILTSLCKIGKCKVQPLKKQYRRNGVTFFHVIEQVSHGLRNRPWRSKPCKTGGTGRVVLELFERVSQFPNRFQTLQGCIHVACIAQVGQPGGQLQLKLLNNSY